MMDLNDDEKVVFDLIRVYHDDEDQISSDQSLKEHLERTQSSMDITKIRNEDGYTALTFAAGKHKYGACKTMIEFIKRRSHEATTEVSTESGF